MTLSPVVDADLPDVVDVLNRRHQVDGPSIRMEVDELRQELSSSLTTMSRDSRVARDESGRIVGLVYTIHLPAHDVPAHEVRPGTALPRCYVEGCVDPDARGRGFGRVLLAWGVEHARELLTSTPNPGTPVIRVSRGLNDRATARLHQRFGFVDVRWFEDLSRPLDDLPARRDPRGVVIEPWPADSSLVLPVKNSAFRDHWGSTPTTPEGWREMVHGFGGRPDLSTVARDTSTGEIVGYLLTHRYPADDAVNGARQVWIDNLGTLASHRGRGVASALIVDALHRYDDHDFTHAMIGVDTDNPSGAHRLYRNLGFTPRYSSVTSEIVLP